MQINPIVTRMGWGTEPNIPQSFTTEPGRQPFRSAPFARTWLRFRNFFSKNINKEKVRNMVKVNVRELPPNMHRAVEPDPMKEPLVQRLRTPGICPIHNFNLSMSSDGTPYCPRCATQALKNDQRDKIVANSSKIARQL